MKRDRSKRIVSWLLLASGLLLLAAGSREFLVSWSSQTDEAENWIAKSEVREQHPRREYRPGELVARFEIPRLNTELFVVSGTGKAQLRRGPGTLEGTALPGERGNAVVAGHRDTHFRVLKDIKKGDRILIEREGEEYMYVVRNLQIVKPSETKVLRPTEKSRLTLVTCYPFYYVGPAPKRYIVQADLVDESATQISSNM
jgi:sortase A